MQTLCLCPPGQFSATFQLPGPIQTKEFYGDFRDDGFLEGVMMRKRDWTEHIECSGQMESFILEGRAIMQEKIFFFLMLQNIYFFLSDWFKCIRVCPNFHFMFSKCLMEWIRTKLYDWWFILQNVGGSLKLHLYQFIDDVPAIWCHLISQLGTSSRTDNSRWIIKNPQDTHTCIHTFLFNAGALFQGLPHRNLSCVNFIMDLLLMLWLLTIKMDWILKSTW